MSNVELDTTVSSSAFSGTGNIVVGQSLTTALSATDSNRLVISNNTSKALIIGDFANNNIIAGSKDMTGPNLYGGQNIIFLTSTSTVPVTGPTGGIALFSTDGTNLQFMGATGGIQYCAPQLFRSYFVSTANTAGVTVPTSTYTAMTGSSPWQTGTTGFINTTKGTFVNGLYTFGADADNSLWNMSVGLRYAANAAGTRWISIAVNGPPATSFVDLIETTANNQIAAPNWGGIIPANSGDTLCILAWQDSGGNRTVIGNEVPPPVGAFGYAGTFFSLARLK